MLAALAGIVLVLGAGFLYAYDTLRSGRVTVGASALAGSSGSASSLDAGSRLADQEASELSELGIDPDSTDLSPEARAAILRAHRAAQANTQADVPASSEPAEDPAGESTGLPE